MIVIIVYDLIDIKSNNEQNSSGCDVENEIKFYELIFTTTVLGLLIYLELVFF
jgi:hypothetical protein